MIIIVIMETPKDEGDKEDKGRDGEGEREGYNGPFLLRDRMMLRFADAATRDQNFTHTLILQSRYTVYIQLYRKVM